MLFTTDIKVNEARMAGPEVHSRIVGRHHDVVVVKGGTVEMGNAGEYPFLSQFPLWELVSYKLDEGLVESLKALDKAWRMPTLRIVRDDKVVDLHVEGVSYEEARDLWGFRLSAPKGAFALSKRLSRIMRPHRIFKMFEGGREVEAWYTTFPMEDEWDGALLISDSGVAELAATLVERKGLDVYTKLRLLREAEEANRFNVTLMGENGQYKGHALRVPDHDPRLKGKALAFPDDPKGSVKMTGGFIGIEPIHGSDTMIVDIQSAINLGAFFGAERMMRYVRKEGSDTLAAIAAGTYLEEMARVHGIRTNDDLERMRDWPLAEFLASGGDIRWFPTMVKGAAGPHLKKMENTTREGRRFPYHGGALYLFSDQVKGMEVEAGHVLASFSDSSIYVPREEYVEIAGVLGGADQDDRINITPFRDVVDGEEKFLLTRTPNQLGEYIVRRVDARSDVFVWDEYDFPSLDSRLLPPRIDSEEYPVKGYLQNEDADHREGMIFEEYHPSKMYGPIAYAVQNVGALGAYINVLMTHTLIYATLPEQLPARVESVIDSTVKTGADVSLVKSWCKGHVAALVAAGVEIPACVVERVVKMVPETLLPQLTTSNEGWYDVLLKDLDEYIVGYNEEVAQLAAEARPPLAVIQAGRGMAREGKMLEAAYYAAHREYSRLETSGHVPMDRWEWVRVEMEWELATTPFPSEMILGAAAHEFMTGFRSQRGGYSDPFLWVPGEKEWGGKAPGVSNHWLDTLRGIYVDDGAPLLYRPIWEEDRAVLRPDGELEVAPVVATTLTNVWFNRAVAHGFHHYGYKLADARKAYGKRMCEWVEKALSPNEEGVIPWEGKTLYSKTLANGRVVVCESADDDAPTLGYVRPGDEALFAKSNQWILVAGRARNGDVDAVLHAVA